MDFGPHGGFIVAAYAFTALIMVGLVANAWRDRAAAAARPPSLRRDRR